MDDSPTDSKSNQTSFIRRTALGLLAETGVAALSNTVLVNEIAKSLKLGTSKRQTMIDGGGTETLTRTGLGYST
ncbi:hypothetical protein [Halocatena marina]|uniref:Uncharacterized protein n=1 Tax=Halocatena marina TaxID=2934937 RepID=A0ABD5YY25_9EURY|nr:hypothetical protein [Halocatena marina]